MIVDFRSKYLSSSRIVNRDLRFALNSAKRGRYLFGDCIILGMPIASYCGLIISYFNRSAALTRRIRICVTRRPCQVAADKGIIDTIITALFSIA